MTDGVENTKQAPVDFMKYNNKLSLDELRGSIALGQRMPPQPRFAGIDIEAVRRKRMEELSKEVEGAKTMFNKQFAELFWLTAFPIVSMEDLTTTWVAKGPCWLYDAELTNALIKGTDENLVLLQPHLGFNYAVSEVLWKGKNLLVLDVRPHLAFAEAKLYNVTLVFAHGEQETYARDVAQVTNFAVQDALPTGLLLHE
jgi:hypothetical protein